MSLVIGRIAGDYISIVSDTKITDIESGDIGLKQHPKDGLIKVVILNRKQCVAFSGNIIFAEDALKEIGNGGAIDGIIEVLYRYAFFQTGRQSSFLPMLIQHLGSLV